MNAYRYPNERLILAATLLLVLLVITVTATATVCASLIFVLLFIGMAYSSSRSHHQALMRRAYPVSSQTLPRLVPLIQRSVDRLQPGRVVFYVTPNPTLNAYTFGLEDPKVVVLYSSLFNVMDEDELSFILGHELGHVALGHTWLNSLVGSMAGIPASALASVVLATAFLSWNRACEFSADRAGLIACGSLEKAITALVKLEAGPEGHTAAGLEEAYRRIDAQDDTWLGSLGEALGTHPMLIRRINELRRYAASPQYQRLHARAAQLG